MCVRQWWAWTKELVATWGLWLWLNCYSKYADQEILQWALLQLLHMTSFHMSMNWVRYSASMSLNLLNIQVFHYRWHQKLKLDNNTQSTWAGIIISDVGTHPLGLAKWSLHSFWSFRLLYLKKFIMQASTSVKHLCLPCHWSQRPSVTADCIRTYGATGRTIVFTDTKKDANELASSLESLGAKALHGDIPQNQREVSQILVDMCTHHAVL